ncbi:class I SAM-dependent methyltransferase [Herbaspirillum sp.]|uniref:class I SAM-dependent methyltransferase n=1 Tax=Herbaspirillum sp. TaxID=1890675 RepID=UPI001B105DE9|nr:class I SAM-dependent methyltransferase [Herbaspirillum sp.]MBO9536970.1 class I SAM-dependent methyltransferase [Herbaspirillum sp.]
MTHDTNAGVQPTLVEQYQRAFAEHGDTPAGVMWPRGRQALRFDALTRHFPDKDFSVLDYGCGLAHLKAYLDQRCSQYEYLGADLVPEFVSAATAKYPEARVQLVQSYMDVSTPVDHIVISGTFNIIEGDDREAYIKRVQAALMHLFGLARKSLAVNFMTDRVDFMQPQALHMNVEEMIAFMRRSLSPRLRLDESYMPYEFTLVALKNSEIIRPDNIYQPL